MDKCDELLWGGVAGSAASTLHLLALCINSLALLSIDDRHVLADLQVRWWLLGADCWSYSLPQRQVGVLHKPGQETSSLDDLFSKSRVHNSQNVGRGPAGNWGEQAITLGKGREVPELCHRGAGVLAFRSCLCLHVSRVVLTW